MAALPYMQPSIPLRNELIDDGWFSPDTYSSCFRPLPDDAAVYLFMLLDERSFKEALVAYVGMSVRVRQRIASHNILPTLDIDGLWPMKWFKPTDTALLREVEGHHIHRFNPPWNIAGKRRGVGV